MSSTKVTISLQFAVAVLLLPLIQLRAQNVDSRIESLVESVSLDSLVMYVGELSGERPIYVSDSARVVYIDSLDRTDTVWVSNQWLNLPNRQEKCNEAATRYLYAKLRAFGYDSVVVDSYYQRPFTHNVVAYKAGTDEGGPTWLIGAHYDSVLRAPGADDNASGTAVTLEAARILSSVPTSASIIFGLWDSEEAGLFGSDLFAGWAYDNVLRIDGVLNFDMVAWDGDDDRKLQIHARDEEAWLAHYIANVVGRYGIGVVPDMQIPGGGRSDHVSFRNWGYQAVKLIEEEGDDFNPYYHSADDVIANFDLGFFHEVAKLAVATLGELALSGTAVAVEEEAPDPSGGLSLAVYPNPATGVLNIEYGHAESGENRLRITDLLGRSLADVSLDSRSRIFQWAIPIGLPNGVYFATLLSDRATNRSTFVIAR